MVFSRDVHHPNDVTCQFLENKMPEKLKNYFKLPGKFVQNFPTTIVMKNGEERKMDWLILVEADNDQLIEEILINVEFQSSFVSKKKIRAMADYSDYSKIYYGRPVLTVIIITDGYESSQKEYKRTASDIFKPIYIYMKDEEITERLNNLEKKIFYCEQLSDDEALDVVFLPMFSSKRKAKFITEKITRLFSMDESLKGVFRYDIAYALSFMIRKYFDASSKAKELLKLIEPEFDKSDLRDIIDFEVDYIRKSLEKEVSKRDDALAEKDTVLAEKDIVLAEKDIVLAEKDRKIKELEEKLAINGIE